MVVLTTGASAAKDSRGIYAVWGEGLIGAVAEAAIAALHEGHRLRVQEPRTLKAAIIGQEGAADRYLDDILDEKLFSAMEIDAAFTGSGIGGTDRKVMGISG